MYIIWYNYIYISISMSISMGSKLPHPFLSLKPRRLYWSSHGWQAEETSRPGGGSAHQRSGRCRRGGICSSDSFAMTALRWRRPTTWPLFFRMLFFREKPWGDLGPLRLRNYVAPMDHWRWCRHPIMTAPWILPSRVINQANQYVGWFSPTEHLLTSISIY